jgi:hypothetical protein
MKGKYLQMWASAAIISSHVMLLFNELPTVRASTPTSLEGPFSSKRALLITLILEDINVLYCKLLVIKNLANVFRNCF